MSVARPANSHDVIILGAGAAGLMCAGVAAKRGRSVLLLEQARHPGEKIRISGGGRCNFTNLHTSPGEFSVRQSAVLPFGAQRIHPARLHRTGRGIRHRLAREDARAIVLRWLVAADHRHAAGRMPKRANAPRHSHLGDRERRGGLRRYNGSRRISLPLAGGRHRRSVDSENGRERIRLQDRRTIRPQDRAAARGAGAVDI